MKKILAFSGSNSKQSINQQFVIAAANLIEGAEVEVLNLRDYEAPVYGIDLEIEHGFPPTMVELNKKFDEADGFLISTPEHNGSMPAAFKNVIDWISRQEVKVFRDKPTVFLSTAPGPRGGASALEHLVAIMPYRGAEIVGQYSLGSFSENYENGSLNTEVTNELKSVVNKLV
jgi:NAD(P)H-dependent FMN reductase